MIPELFSCQVLSSPERQQLMAGAVEAHSVLRAEKKIKTVTIGSRVYVASAELEAFITKEGGLDA